MPEHVAPSSGRRVTVVHAASSSGLCLYAWTSWTLLVGLVSFRPLLRGDTHFDVVERRLTTIVHTDGELGISQFCRFW